ncbi:hypothetical protein ACIF6L_34740 [Kitasatospora sp. NPDC086009]|uniref:hypothetical protein n=1 Tax=unclassified Kitasatospora TaxID=2633591 RepID=UPI0037C63A7F
MSSLSDPEQHHVVITSDGLSGSFHLNGADISKSVRGYGVRHLAGEPAQVVIYPKEGIGVVFDGLATVTVADDQPQDQADAVAEFLAGIDADQLAAAVFKRTDLDGGRNELTRAALRQLLDWAKGRP